MIIKVYRHYISKNFLWLLFIEWLLFFIVMYWSAAIRILLINPWYSPQQILVFSLIFSLVLTACCTAFGLYRKTLNKHDYYLMERIGCSFLGAGFLLTIISYIFPYLIADSRIMALAFTLSFLGLLLTRDLIDRYAKTDAWQRKVLIIGKQDMVNQLQEIYADRLFPDFKVVGCISLDSNAENDLKQFKGERKFQLAEFVRQEKIDEVVIAEDADGKSLPTDELMLIKMSGVEVMDLMNFYEREQRLILLDMLNPRRLIFSDGFVNSGIRPLIKRCFDIFASALLLLFSWWAMLLTVVAIFIESGFKLNTPILYRQERVGYQNKLFNVIKFRSMVVDAEQNGPQWASKTDDRVTRVGRFIRKYRIDELPQLFNVLRGDMSFVGPRPERPEFVNSFVDSIPYYRERHMVKPGITGWAQLCYPYGANEEDTRQKLQYDLYYVKNYSTFLDFAIILGTVEVVIFGKGAR